MTNAADDFDALFEEVSAQRATSAAPAAAPAPVAAAPVAAAEDDLEALFEQVSATRVAEPAPVAAPAPAAAAAREGDEHGDNPMYERLGGIVRLLHDSLRELGYDKALSEASTQIVDAQDRLEYVASLTEQAANKVLNTLDEGMPQQDQLSQQARAMEQRWEDLFTGKLSVDEFKALAGDTRSFTKLVSEATEAEKARLLDIMMAQDFQDITGQLIKKVVIITKTVENELAELLRDSAPPAVRERLAAKEHESIMGGPSMPTVALTQDSVDDLLADLGF